MRAAKCGGQSVRLVGGNTGPGVYKDWPVDIDVLIGTTGVKELTGITNREVSSNTLRICSHGSSHDVLLLIVELATCLVPVQQSSLRNNQPTEQLCTENCLSVACCVSHMAASNFGLQFNDRLQPNTPLTDLFTSLHARTCVSVHMQSAG